MVGQPRSRRQSDSRPKRAQRHPGGRSPGSPWSQRRRDDRAGDPQDDQFSTWALSWSRSRDQTNDNRRRRHHHCHGDRPGHRQGRNESIGKGGNPVLVKGAATWSVGQPGRVPARGGPPVKNEEGLRPGRRDLRQRRRRGGAVSPRPPMFHRRRAGIVTGRRRRRGEDGGLVEASSSGQRYLCRTWLTNPAAMEAIVDDPTACCAAKKITK